MSRMNCTFSLPVARDDLRLAVAGRLVRRAPSCRATIGHVGPVELRPFVDPLDDRRISASVTLLPPGGISPEAIFSTSVLVSPLPGLMTAYCPAVPAIEYREGGHAEVAAVAADVAVAALADEDRRDVIDEAHATHGRVARLRLLRHRRGRGGDGRRNVVRQLLRRGEPRGTDSRSVRRSDRPRRFAGR